MSDIKLYETECLVYVEDTKPCEYWVLRIEGVSPLASKHKVKKKHVAEAVALFKDHPEGIQNIKLEDLHFVEGESWNPTSALEHKAESIN